MAERALKDLPIPQLRVRYPWQRWMDGSTWLLEYGVDFFASVKSFRNRCYSKATRSGMHAAVNVVELAPSALLAARGWLTEGGWPERLGGDPRSIPTTQVYDTIDRHYEGGWERFAADHTDPADTGRGVIVARVRFFDAADAPVPTIDPDTLGVKALTNGAHG